MKSRVDCACFCDGLTVQHALKEGDFIYPDINSKTEYDDKLYQAEYAYDHRDYATASMYFIACLNYAQNHGLPTGYLEMKVQDCKRNGYTD